MGLEEWSADNIVAHIQELTQDKSLPWKERRQKMIDHCGEMSATARLVKLADRLDNICDMGSMDRKFKTRYCKEARAMLKNMGGTCPEIEHELVERVTREEIKLEEK